MTTMVERMARAMHNASDASRFVTWDRMSDGYQRASKLQALAALRELREGVSNDALGAMYTAMFADDFDGTTAPMLNAGFTAAIDAEIAAYEGK